VLVNRFKYELAANYVVYGVYIQTSVSSCVVQRDVQTENLKCIVSGDVVTHSLMSQSCYFMLVRFMYFTVLIF